MLRAKMDRLETPQGAMSLVICCDSAPGIFDSITLMIQFMGRVLSGVQGSAGNIMMMSGAMARSYHMVKMSSADSVTEHCTAVRWYWIMIQRTNKTSRTSVQ